MNYFNKYIFVGILLQISFVEAASAFLIESISGKPLKKCTVQISFGKISITSDNDGKINIPIDKKIVTTEKLKILITSGEYSGFTTEIDSSLEEQIVMVSKLTDTPTTPSQKVKSLREFSIHKTNAFTSKLLSKDEIKNSFQVNFNDLVKAIQTKAGVSYSGRSSTSMVYVQGSPNRNTTFLYDEIDISTSSSRLGEYASMFNPLLMGQVQLYKAGYAVNVLGGTSGVVSLKSLDCDFQKWNLFLGVDNSVEFMVNGPIYKNKVAGFFHVRRTIVEAFARLSANKERRAQIATLPNILDINTKISAKIGENGVLNFLAILSRESMATKDLKKTSKMYQESNDLEHIESKYDHKAWLGIWTINYQHTISPSTTIFGSIGQTPTISETSRIAFNPKTEKEETTDGIETFKSSTSSYNTQLVIKANHKISPHQTVDAGIRIHVLPRKFEFNGYGNHFGLLPTTNQGKYLTTPSQKSIKEIGFLISPHIQHSWSPFHNVYISEGIRLDGYLSGTPLPISGSGHLHIEYRKIPIFRIYQHFGVYSQHIVSSYGKVINVTDKSTKPEYSAHAVFGAQTLLKYFLVNVEPFFKYNWNTLFSRNTDMGLDNSGKSYNTGLSVGILQMPSPKDFINVSFGYMFVLAKEKVTFRKEAPTDNFYQYKTSLTTPKVGEWALPSHVRNHTLALKIKTTPFIGFTQLKKLPNWLKKPSFVNQSFNFQFIFLTGAPYTRGQSVIKKADADWPNLFTYQIIPGEYHSSQTPNIYKLDMRYTIPIRKRSEFFLTFLNLLNLRNEYIIKNMISANLKDPSIQPGTYKEDMLEIFGQSSTGSGIGKNNFSIRFGINIWIEIQNKTVKVS